MFCRVKRQAPSLFASAPAAPADRKTERKKEKKADGGNDDGSSALPGRCGFLGRAFRACAQRRPGRRRRRGLQVASDEHLGPTGHDDDDDPAAETEKQWLIESGEASDGALDPEGWGLVRAAAPPAHYA